ncbi:MAG: NAD(+) synthase [Clostridia bacterium]|nr:NAD(+) synthase [Clostridia bacterium]
MEEVEVNFNAEKAKNDIVLWIRDWFDKNGQGCSAVVGISGGKDSSVVAALCVEALGKERVFGVLMPKGEQHDIDVALSLVNHLDIKHTVINIKTAYDAIVDEINNNIELSKQAVINLPPRLRMSTLYAVSQSINGRVANTCNLSEDWVGYSTRWGDSVGDFSPLSNFTVTEVKEIGRVLGLPSLFVDKVPIDGLSGKTDEDNLGFTYDVLDRYIRTGICENEETKKRIDDLHVRNKFKLELMPTFQYICD